MARKPRAHLPGVPQPVVQRGNNREACFFAETDCRYYLDCLSDAAKKYGCRREDPCITEHPLYQHLGASPAQRQHAYRELFRDRMSNDVLNEIREALNHETTLGSSYFKENIEQVINRRVQPARPSRPRIEEEGEVYEVY